jgi:hypothetical protein
LRDLILFIGDNQVLFLNVQAMFGAATGTFSQFFSLLNQ